MKSLRFPRAAVLVLAPVAAIACGLSSAHAVDRPPPKTPAMLEALRLEERADETLPLARWSGEGIRELARSLDSLPEALAAEALCLVAAAPASIDTNVLFATALGSTSGDVRRLAASFLAGGISSDSRRFLLNTLSTERNPEIIHTIIQGMANLPLRRAVPGLMDVMYLPGEHPPVVEAAAEELRRLTGAGIADNAGDWRDWWLDNEGNY